MQAESPVNSSSTHDQSPPDSPESHTSPPLSSRSPTATIPTHSSLTQLSNAPPNSPTRTPPPLHALFTTEDSDDQEPKTANDSSDSESKGDNGITFKSFGKARFKKKVAKKKLMFIDNQETEEPNARPRRVDPKVIHCETQRMIRESKIRIPEYVPPTITLQEVLKKLPKLTSPPVKPDPLPSPPPCNHATSTPLPKSCRAPTAPSQLDDLPEVEFLTDEPVQGLELTQEQLFPRLDTLKLRSISASLPTPTLAANDVTHLDLTPDADTPPVSTLESFKSRFITQSIGPVRKKALPPANADTAQLEEDSDSLLSSATLSKLANKPGAAHALLHDKLRRSLMARRAQEHEEMRLRLRYENEELLPSEESCGVAGGGEGAEGIGGGSPVDAEDSGSYSSSCSSSSESEVSGSEGTSDAESDGSGDDSSDSEDIPAPNLKAKRQLLNEDSDSEGPLLDGDSAAQSDLSCALLEYSQPPNHSPSQSTEDQLSGQTQDENEAPPVGQMLPCEIDYHSSDALLDSFRIPSQFQPSESQVSVPEGLLGMCDPLTQEGESQLAFMCTGNFVTQATQAVDKDRSVLAPLLVEPDKSPVASLQLDDTMDADIPVLAPRPMRAKDKLRLSRYRKLAEFEDKEAELSGSEHEVEGSEYGSELGDELDEYEPEEGDLDLVESEQLERANAKYYNKIMIEDDEANLELLRDRFLPEQDVVEDGLRMKHGLFRKRKFNFDAELESSGDPEWGEEGREDEGDQAVSQERRRRRVEREDYIARKSLSALSELKYGDTRTLPLAEKPTLVRTSSCDPSTLAPAVPSIRKSLVKPNSLLSRSLSTNTKLNPSLNSESSSESNLVGRKAFVFQTTRSLEGKEDSSSAAPSLTRSTSVPASSSVSRQGRPLNKNKKKSEFAKDVSFAKPTSFFHLLNAN